MDQHVRAAALRFAAKVALSVSAFACAPHVSLEPAQDGTLDEAYVWWECCMLSGASAGCMAWGPPMPAEMTDEVLRAWEMAA